MLPHMSALPALLYALGVRVQLHLDLARPRGVRENGRVVYAAVMLVLRRPAICQHSRLIQRNATGRNHE